MSLTDSRLTRTSASTGSEASAGAPPSATTQMTSARRGRRIVRAVVWWTRVSRVLGAALASAAAWSARTVRPAGLLVVIAATLGLGIGIAFGWVEWMVAGAIALLLVVMCVPFLFGARSYDVDLVPRTSGSWRATGSPVRSWSATTGAEWPCPAGSTSPSEQVWWSSACRC